MLRIAASHVLSVVSRGSLIASALSASLAFGFVPERTPALKTKGIAASKMKQRVLRPTLVEGPRFDGSSRREWLDQISGAQRLIQGEALLGVKISSHPTSEEVVVAATAALEQLAPMLQVKTSDLRLQPTSVLAASDIQSASFEVYRDGLRIVDASLTLRFKLGHLVQIANETFSEAATPAAKGTLSGLEGTVKAFFVGQPVSFQQEAWRVTAGDDGYALTRIVEYWVGDKDTGLLVQANAATGAIFEVRSPRLFHDEFSGAPGKASAPIYPRVHTDSLVEAPLPLLQIKNAKADSDENGSFEASGDKAPTTDGLKGARVKITASGGSAAVKGTASNDNGLWALKLDVAAESVKPYENTLIAQTMAYTHTNAIIAYAKRFITSPWFDKAVTVKVNVGQTCNAYWFFGTINLFKAGPAADDPSVICANTALISDVIYHEWGHGLDENTGGIADGAFSEGFGDTLSMIMNLDHRLGIEFEPETHGMVRDLEPDMVHPKDLQDEVHADGLIFGGAVWDMFKQMRDVHGQEKAREIVANYLFKVIFTARKYTDTYAALLVIDDNDGNVSNGTPNLCIINKNFAAHGLAEADARCP